MSFQEMYGSRGPWGQTAVLQLTYKLRPKWNKNNNNKTQNAVSRSDPLQGSDKNSGDKDVWKTMVDLGSTKVAAATAASTTIQPRLVATHVPPGNIIRPYLQMQNIIICKI